jgi:tRNA U34 5-methylaminomethyl-2-thiouridine-forming methyltransferase MnmC
MHVFINAGFKHFALQNDTVSIRILEMGFGTGLNALLTIDANKIFNRQVYYHGLDTLPLKSDITAALNYASPYNYAVHKADWNKAVTITPHFTLHKQQISLEDFEANHQYHIIYYDAFAPAAQPELWTKEIFQKIYNMLLPGGLLVTYCCKGDVRRTMLEVGFIVEKIPGPPGKREMIRASKS